MSPWDRDERRSLSPRLRHKHTRTDGDDFDDKDRDDRHSSHRRRRRSRSRDDERPRKRRSISPRDNSDDGRRKDRYRDRSPHRPHRSHHRTKRSRSRSRSPQALSRSRAPLPSQNAAFKREQNPAEPAIEKQKPNFKATGRLAAASNTVQTAGQTIVLKYHEPPEARKPPAKNAWRMYVFKNDEIVDTIQLYEQSCWLFGRELAVTDVPIEHPSCSKQHAVVQFRYIEKRNEFGDKIGKVKPYVLDLESSNGTFVNGERIEAARYLELRDKDVVKFGHSRREYVIQLPGSEAA